MVKPKSKVSSALELNKVTVVVTVFNESATIDSLIASLKSQTLTPNEVIVVDGESTDGTYQKLQSLAKSWPILKIFKRQGNRSVGRNLAIANSKFQIIAITDAGCQPDPDWLENIIAPFSNPDVKIVSGYYRGLAKTVFQKCLIPYVLVMPDKAEKYEFFPSTRSMAMRKEVWQKSEGFPENLFHNEDFAYAHKLKKLGYQFTFASKAVVGWFPRTTLKSAAWMFLRFAIGDIQSGILRRKVKFLVIRYWAFLFFVFLSFEIPWLFKPLSLICFAYLAWAIAKNYKYVKHVGAFFWLPVLQITADITVLFGSLVGLLSRSTLK